MAGSLVALAVVVIVGTAWIVTASLRPEPTGLQRSLGFGDGVPAAIRLTGSGDPPRLGIEPQVEPEPVSAADGSAPRQDEGRGGARQESGAASSEGSVDALDTSTTQDSQTGETGGETGETGGSSAGSTDSGGSGSDGSTESSTDDSSGGPGGSGSGDGSGGGSGGGGDTGGPGGGGGGGG
jgi:hypothetical protein